MIDPRMQKLISALSGGRGGVGGVKGGVGGRGGAGVGSGLGSYGASSSPYGAGGMFSAPISFNPFGAQSAAGFQGLLGPSQGGGDAAAAVATPPSVGGDQAQPDAPAAPTFYGSAGDAQPASPWMSPPAASQSGGVPGQSPQDILGRILSMGRQL